MFYFNAYFREKVIRKFIEICDLHPVHGSYFREYSLDMRQFYTKCERNGYDWYRWEEVRKQCMSLEDMISALEDALGKKAKKEFLPMQPGDVPATSADTSSLEEWINIKPNTSIKKGVKYFVDWYREFYSC